MNYNRSKLIFAWMLGASSLILPAAAFAQKSDQDTSSASESGNADSGDIIVTAQKREQRLQDVGLTITAFNADKLQGAGITRSDEIAKLLTNVVVRPTAAGEVPSFSIRGISSGAAIFTNTSPPVALNVDGVYLISNALSSFALFDIERVEVLKGPQGTLFGKNTTGGVVNYVTAQPKFENSGYVDLSYQRFNDVRVSAAANLLLSENSALRLSLLSHHGDGHVYDRVSGNHLSAPNIWAGRAALKTDLGAWTITVNIHGGIDRTRPLQQDQSGLVGPGCRDVAKGERTPITCTDTFGYVDTDNDPFAGAWSRTYRRRNEAVGSLVQIDGDLGSLSFTSVTGFEHLKRKTPSDEDAGPQRTVDIDYRERLDQFSQEFRISSNRGGRLYWIAGAFLEWNEISANRDVLNFSNSFDIRFRSINKGRSAAAFADMEYNLSDKLRLIAGLRYTWEQKKNVTSNAFFVLNEDTILQQRCAVATCSGNQSWNDPSGRVSLEYRPTPNNLLYASYNRGFKSGGWPAGATVLPQTYRSYDPEYVNSFEIGAKTSSFDRRLTINMSGFYYKYSNKQEYSLIPGATPASVLQVYSNAASATIYGAELETNVRFSNGLTFEGGVGYLHSRYDEFNLPPEVANNAAATDLSGNEFALAPKFTATGALTYQARLENGLTITPKISARYQSSMWWTPANLNYLAEKGYATVDTRIDVNLPGDAVRLSAFMLNLTNKVYRTSATVSPINSYYSTYGLPRVYGISARYQF